MNIEPVPGGPGTVAPRAPEPLSRRSRASALLTLAVRHPAVVPTGAVVLAVLIGAAIVLAAGLNPISAYSAVLAGALDLENLDYTFSVWALICGMALAAAIPLRMGEFNLGGNGQMVLGGLAAAFIAGQLDLPSILLIPLAVVAAGVVAGAFGAISAPLSTRYGIPIIISTLLLSPVAVAIVSYLLRFQLGEAGSAVAQTERFPDSAHMWALGSLSYSNMGLILIIVLMALFWLVDSRSAVGFELRVIGANRRFASYGGVRVGRLAFGAMAASGAVAGVVGAIIVLSPPYRLVDGALLSPGYTFAGLAAALLAGGRPAFVPLTAALFTILQVGGGGMERSADVPRQLSDVLQGVVIIVLALRTIVDSRRTGRSATS
ncbi:nucleoside ABC transporter membrane protein [Glaciihabitans tibetensis]|uniref:Nucleoside ABC transporter membrane protein n=1 Tax=Glaciihabitans tibetensis TaxID=1266600 RepID=A0A2T0VJA7_9MICO|nr:ABC transporter permease [Glaciihabitans tibetensis]PRY70298.1 nucleoside ABC transporter membrane protein [Glaciihabitans tibetensis]